MEQLLKFLNEPVVITLLTLSIGSYLFAILAERRAKKEKVREQALQLFAEVGSDLNSVISLIYGHVRKNNFEIPKGSPIDEKRVGLFTKRFSVRIKSQVFLQSDEFWRRYEQLMFEIDRIVRLMISMSGGYVLEDVVKTVEENRERFAADWPFEDKDVHPKYDPPSDELVKWVDMVWDRSVWLLTQSLKVVLR